MKDEFASIMEGIRTMTKKTFFKMYLKIGRLESNKWYDAWYEFKKKERELYGDNKDYYTY